jgi:hypothetical protein
LEEIMWFMWVARSWFQELRIENNFLCLSIDQRNDRQAIHIFLHKIGKFKMGKVFEELWDWKGRRGVHSLWKQSRVHHNFAGHNFPQWDYSSSELRL